MHYTLAHIIADLAQNAVEAGSTVINLTVVESDDELSFELRDNGKGMSPEELERAKDPFYTDGVKHPSRKIGLGIPLLLQTTAATGGAYSLSSQKGAGATVWARFDKTHIDTPPVGDIPALFRQVLAQSGSFELVISRKKTGAGETDYRLVRSELLDALGDFETVDSLSLLGQYLQGLED